MGSLSDIAGNYFLGTGLRQRYAAHRSVVREFCSTQKSVQRRLSDLTFDEYADLALGRCVPNGIGLAGIVLGIAVAPMAAPVMIATGELLRLYRFQTERDTYRSFERWERLNKEMAAIDNEMDQSRRMRENIEAGRDPLDGLTTDWEDDDPADFWKKRNPY